MPLPILVPIAMGLAGLFGVGKTANAVVRNDEADNIHKKAKNVIEAAELNMKKAKETCNDSLRMYGEIKISVLNTEISNFIDMYSKLKNVTLDHSEELERLKVGNFTEVSLAELKQSSSFASSLTGSATKGAGFGVLTAFGAYSGTMALASAGTGAAIGTLSGVAATNATLAWLGGGTLAAGGYGVAGGTMVLGTLVAGPAMFILGGVLEANASKKLDEAKTNLEQAKTFQSESDVVIEKLRAITEVSVLGCDLMKYLKSIFIETNKDMDGAISKCGYDYSLYDEEARNSVFRSVVMAQLVKKVIDTPVLNEHGELHKGALIGFTGIKDELELDQHADSAYSYTAPLWRR